MNLIHQLPPEAHAAIAAIWQAWQEREITTINKKYFEIAKKRIEQAEKQPPLFVQ